MAIYCYWTTKATYSVEGTRLRRFPPPGSSVLIDARPPSTPSPKRKGIPLPPSKNEAQFPHQPRGQACTSG